EMTVEQLPNRIYPQGLKASRSQMAEGFEKGRKLFSSQSYEIESVVAHEESVAAEGMWAGTLAVGVGNLAPGSQMRAHSAMFFEFDRGQIVKQRNYDCFEAW